MLLEIALVILLIVSLAGSAYFFQRALGGARQEIGVLRQRLDLQVGAAPLEIIAALDPFHGHTPLEGVEVFGRHIRDNHNQPSGSPANFETTRGSTVIEPPSLTP